MPESVVPAIDGVMLTPVDNAVPQEWGIFVQGKSGVVVEAVNAQGVYGSEITGYTYMGGANATTSENSYTVNAIPQSGEVTFTVRVTDSRGRTASKSETIYVYEYESPSFSGSSATRCAENGEASDTGTYVSAKSNYTFSDCNGENKATLSAYYSMSGYEEWALGADEMEANEPYVFGGGSIDSQHSYQVKFILTDAFGTVEKTMDVTTAMYTIFFKRGGQGIAFGKACERDNAVEISEEWQLLYGATDVIEWIKGLEERITALGG